MRLDDPHGGAFVRATFAWGLVALVLGASALAIMGPAPAVLVVLAASAIALRSGRLPFALFAATTILLYAAIVAFVTTTPPTLRLAGHEWSQSGAWEGVVAGARMASVLGANLALLSRVPAPLLVDALRLPRTATLIAGAVLVAANDLAEDHSRLREAQLLDGEDAAPRRGRWARAAHFLPALFVAAERRARTRSDALVLSGMPLGEWLVPVLAVAALSAAGRMALLPLPNVKLTYAVVFLAGVVYGARAAFVGGALGMLVTDVMLSGFYPMAFVNVPAMGALALFGAALRRLDFSGASRADRVAGRVFAFAAGILATLLFSLLADVVTWLVFLHSQPGALVPLLLAGIAFNVFPAIGNGVIFALSVGPVQRAFRALGQDPQRAQRG